MKLDRETYNKKAEDMGVTPILSVAEYEDMFADASFEEKLDFVLRATRSNYDKNEKYYIYNQKEIISVKPGSTYANTVINDVLLNKHLDMDLKDFRSKSPEDQLDYTFNLIKKKDLKIQNSFSMYNQNVVKISDVHDFTNKNSLNEIAEVVSRLENMFYDKTNVLFESKMNPDKFIFLGDNQWRWEAKKEVIEEIKKDREHQKSATLKTPVF